MLSDNSKVVSLLGYRFSASASLDCYCMNSVITRSFEIFDCETSWRYFSNFWCQLGVSSPYERDLSWQGSFVGKRCKKAWMIAPLCIFWTLWRERNRLVFEGVNISINRMKSTFLCNL